jgi:hypothetical protein
VQVLQYAGRAVQLTEEMFGERREEQFLERLQEAGSNIPGCGNGRQVYERFVRPAMLDLLGVGAHYAISSLFDGCSGPTLIHCYRVDLEESRTLESGRTKLALGRARVRSTITGARLTVSFGALHFGDHNLSAGVRPFVDEGSFRTLVEEASQAFSAADLPECLRVIDRHFAGATYSLKSLFRDEQRRIVTQIVNSTMGEAEAMYRQVYENHAPLLCFLAELHAPLPTILRLTAEYALGSAVRRTLADPGADVDRIQTLLDTARRDGINLDASCLESALRQRLNALIDQWASKPGDLGTLEMVEALVSLARVPPFEVNLWKSQNVYYELLQAVSGAPPAHVSAAWLDHFRGLGDWLRVAPQPSPVLPYVTQDEPLSHLPAHPHGSRSPL